MFNKHFPEVVLKTILMPLYIVLHKHTRALVEPIEEPQGQAPVFHCFWLRQVLVVVHCCVFPASWLSCKVCWGSGFCSSFWMSPGDLSSGPEACTANRLPIPSSSSLRKGTINRLNTSVLNIKISYSTNNVYTLLCGLNFLKLSIILLKLAWTIMYFVAYNMLFIVFFFQRR